MAKLEPKIPNAVILPTEFKKVQGAGTPRNVQPMNFNSEDVEMTSGDDVEFFPLDAQNVKTDVATAGLYNLLYERGINILRPEIVMTSEYVPITKSGIINNPQGSQLNADLLGNDVVVNEVLRLIELHLSVQKSINDASLNFINSAANFDTEDALVRIRSNYSSSVLSDTLDETIDKFIDRLT